MSDSHGNYPRALKAHELAGQVDQIIHLGDGTEDALLLEQLVEVPVIRVAGNCDREPLLPQELTLEIDDCRFFLTHGNRELVKSGLGPLIGRGIEVGANVILYGHTHLPAVQTVADLLLVNPGALRQGLAGSYAILTVTGSEVQAELFPI